jgi:hypothetical protein
MSTILYRISQKTRLGRAGSACLVLSRPTPGYLLRQNELTRVTKKGLFATVDEEA